MKSVKFSKEESIERIKSSISWMKLNIKYFTPLGNNSIDPRGFQSFAELCILTMFCHYLPEENTINKKYKIKEKIIQSLSPHLETHLKDPKLIEIIRRNPCHVHGLLLPYLCLKSIGYSDAHYDELLDKALQNSYFQLTERVPYRYLETSYIFYKANCINTRNFEKLLNDGSILYMENPIHLDKEAIYALTHTMIYATDFGRWELQLNRASIDQLTDIVECLIVDCIIEKSWDLLGELLISAICLKIKNSSIFCVGLNTFYNAWRSPGIIPGFEYLAMPDSNKDSTSKEDANKSIWNTYYHTTLVWIVFFIMVNRDDDYELTE